MSFKSGDTEQFSWHDSSKQMNRLKFDKLDEHDTEITSIDVHLKLQLYLTTSNDCLVKLWTFMKELVREIKFPEPINAAIFYNEVGDILVAHGTKMSTIKASDCGLD